MAHVTPESPSKPKWHGFFLSLTTVMAVLLVFATPETACSANVAAVGQSTGADADTGSTDDRSFPVIAGWRGLFAPGSDLYPRYIADPLRPTMAIQYMSVSSDIPETGDRRFLFDLGGRFGLLRIHPAEQTEAGFQIDLQAAFLGMFDLEYSSDGIGWDGLYGMLLTWSSGRGTALKFGMQHDSSHVGDEYMERTGRLRIGYTREEIVLGLSRELMPHLLVYGEGAYGSTLANEEVQEPWRLQGGLQYEDADRLLRGRLGWYAALNVTSYEENDWDANFSIQAGLLAPARELDRSFRLGVAYYHGRSLIGEFSQFDEEYISVGFWIDL